jgi:hypothetical protein
MYGLGEYEFIKQRQQEIRHEVAENRLGKMLLANREGRFRPMGDTKWELEGYAGLLLKHLRRPV